MALAPPPSLLLQFRILGSHVPHCHTKTSSPFLTCPFMYLEKQPISYCTPNWFLALLQQLPVALKNVLHLSHSRLAWPQHISHFSHFSVSQGSFSSSHFRSYHKIWRCTTNANNQVNNNNTEFSILENLSSGLKWAFAIVCTNFLPSVLIFAVLLGLAFPELGQTAYRFGLSKWATFGVFLLSGLALRTDELGEALDAWPSLLFGLISVLALSPLLAIIVLQIHLDPRELVTGLAIFCCVPTTLSSGVSLSKVAGANTVVALSLTLLSNLMGIVTAPFMISNLVARGIGVAIPASVLMKNLVETLVVPLILGKVLRDSVPGVGGFIDKRGKQCSILTSLCLSLVPWMQVSCSSELLLHLSTWNLAAAVALGMSIHFILLGWNIVAMLVIQQTMKTKENYKKSVAWAIILTASQKTLPVTVAIVTRLGGLLGDASLLVLPCVAAHINQIIFDSILVRLWIQDDLQKSQAYGQ